MPYDYSEAPPRLIPAGTEAAVQIRIRAGSVGEDGMLTRSKDGACEMLSVEFAVLEGEYQRRKFLGNLVLAGTTDGHAKAAETNRGLLRTVLESSRGIKPNDMSAQARAARTASLREFDNIIFIGKIGIEKGKPKNDGSGESWPDKNVVAGAVTPGEKNWHPVEQPPPWNGGSGGGASTPPASPAPGIAKPSWAS